jgi:hypothetical protein
VPVVVQGDEEQVGAFEMFQSCPSGADGIAQDGITQRATQLVENGRAQQERLNALRLPLQDLFK